MRRQIVIGKFKRFKDVTITYDDDKTIDMNHKKIKYHDYYLIYDNYGATFTLYYDHIRSIERIREPTS